MTVRDIKIARWVKRQGFVYPYRTVKAARKADISIASALALLTMETGNGKNIFGHDPTIYSGAGRVTRAKYLTYKNRRGHNKMQGVGPCQLTWWATQDAADRLPPTVSRWHGAGTAHPYYNMLQGFKTLKTNVRANGLRGGFRAYNGSGAAASHYATKALEWRETWTKRLKQAGF